MIYHDIQRTLVFTSQNLVLVSWNKTVVSDLEPTAVYCQAPMHGGIFKDIGWVQALGVAFSILSSKLTRTLITAARPLPKAWP